MADDELLSHYGTGYERERLLQGASRIELVRTKELLARFLPPAPASIIDIGGGPGAYATWLAGEGYAVHLVDVVPLHVELARDAAAASGSAFTAEVGDARALTQADATFDGALLLGPLYHLTDREDRVRALAEARRVVRPDGLVVAAAISRFASLFDGLLSGDLDDPAFASIVERDLADGQHRNPTGREGWFTTAYFHHPDELEAEVRDAGLAFEGVYGIEGPGWLVAHLWDDERGRERILRAARAVEGERTLASLSAHLLVVARRSFA